MMYLIAYIIYYYVHVHSIVEGFLINEVKSSVGRSKPIRARLKHQINSENRGSLG